MTAAARERGQEEAVAVAGIITISPGHDASYPWRQIGTSASPAQAGAARRGLLPVPFGEGRRAAGAVAGRRGRRAGFR